MFRSRINSSYRRGTLDTPISGLSRQEGRNPAAAAPKLRRQWTLLLGGLLQRGLVVRRVDLDGVSDAVAAH